MPHSAAKFANLSSSTPFLYDSFGLHSKLQVQTDSGWIRYDENSQTTIKAACSKGREECALGFQRWGWIF